MKFGKIAILSVILLIACLSPTTYAQESDRNYKIGLMLILSSQAFIDEMTALGYVEGEDITYMLPTYDATATQEEFFAQYAQQVQLIHENGADIFIVTSDLEVVGLQQTVGDTPIVFTLSDNPIATGAVQDLVNPGGTVTGVITNKPHERRLQILTEIKPSTKKIYYLYSPLTGEAEAVLNEVKAVAEELDVEVVAAQTPDLESGLAALEAMPEDVDWLFLTPYVPFDPAFSQKLMEVSISHQAGITGVTDAPIPGYLMGYGPSRDDTARQAARITDRILRGASPADLPIETAENFLMINLEASEAIDLEIPVSILRQADLIVRPGYFDNLAPLGN